MHTLALTSTEKTLWWWAIIVGFVVVLAVAALLTLLVSLVKTIEEVKVGAVRYAGSVARLLG